MRRLSSFGRILLLSLLFIVGLAVVMFALSSYYFSDIYTATQYSAVSEGLRAAEKLLAQYRAGNVDRGELWDAVNPVLSMDGAFYMLLDENRQVLCYTEQAAPYFAGSALSQLLDAADKDESAVVRGREGGKLYMLAGYKTEGGYALAGRPMRILSGAAFSFQRRMLISAVLVLLGILLMGIITAHRAARPARIIREMAGRVVEGEHVELPENLPGAETREIAAALNHMSRAVARAIGDLKQEKETMALILEGLSEGILAVDANGRRLHENAAAWQLLGGEDTDAYRAVTEALRENREEAQWGRKYTAGDRVLYFAVSRLPARENARDNPGTVALIRDITEQERLERTRHDYVANISHELRTPLASIRGLGEGLRDGLVTEDKDRARIYNIIVEEATRLSRLVNDLLELSSLQSNPTAFEMEKVDPNELIYDLHDRNGSLFNEKRLAFERFHQAERGRSDKGSGLGLSIAKEILEKMGVKIALKSAPGQGSEFSFVIPAEI